MSSFRGKIRYKESIFSIDKHLDPWFHHGTMLSRIKACSVPDEIVDQLILQIVTGNVKPGDKLPSERQLAISFGVGRNAVREALIKLQGIRVIRARRPHGNFVQFLTPEVLQKPLERFFEMHIDGVLNFLDVRKWLEGVAAAEAAEHASARKIRAMEATLLPFETAAEKQDREALDASDMAFHGAILEATRNPLLMYLLDSFRNLMWSSRAIRTLILEGSDYQTLCAEHRRVVEAIKARDADAAREAMMLHIQNIRKRVELVNGRAKSRKGRVWVRSAEALA